MMIRSTTIAFVLIGVALALGATACGGGGSSSGGQTTEPTTAAAASTSAELDGEVGPGFTIEVKQHGADAQTVKAGTYTLKVEDKADIHDFHLIGPGVDQVVTDVPFKGEKSVTVTLQKGTYTYRCDPHASGGMKGTFEVT
jgi:plastocyanin